MSNDTMPIFDWWMRPAESLNPAIEALLSHSYDWPSAIRKTYVLTWPVAAPLRLIGMLALMLLWVVLGGIGYVFAALNCVYVGKRNPWQ